MSDQPQQPAPMSMDDIAASIQKKLGGDTPARDERGRFVPPQKAAAETTDETTESPTPESGEPEEGEADEGDLPEEVEATEDGQDEKPQTYTVKVNGQDESVTLEALLSSYSKDADYRQKTAALAEKERAWESTREQSLKADRDALQAEREQAKQILTGWQNFVEAQFGNKEYWDNLRKENPGEWAAQQQALSQQLKDIQDKAAELQKKDQQKRESDLNAHKAAEFQKLVTAIPEWKDQAKLNEGYQKAAAYAVKVRGFEPKDLGAFAMDHRLMLVFRDAEAFHALEQKKPEIAPKPKDIKPAKPGPSALPNGKASQDRKTFERFAKSGSQYDLAAHLARKFNLSG
jgi:hypothetical protein